jgi:uncharacterized protein DUF6799
MKKLFVFLAFAGFVTACTDTSESKPAAGDTTSTSTVTPAPDTTATTTASPVKDSVMQFKEGKVLIMVGGSWTPLSAALTTTNGRKVTPGGEVSKGGKTRKLEEGMMIDKDGQLMDKDGKMVDNTGWE